MSTRIPPKDSCFGNDKTSDEVIQELENQLQEDEALKALLVTSLQKAKDVGKANLDADLYETLESAYTDENGAPVGWPETPDAYLAFLRSFATFLPQENTNSRVEGWNDPGTGYSQEVFDRLVHYYWLIDQPIPLDGNEIVLQSYTDTFDMPTWVHDYAGAWGSFLSQEGSLTEETLNSFKENPSYRMQDYSEDEPNWGTIFNNFFSRELNKGLRPITDPDKNTTIVAPADCTFRAAYPIDENGNVIDEDGDNAQVLLKQTHVIGSVQDLLGETVPKEIAERFNNGNFLHFFLGPTDYHRFHAPVSGKVEVSAVVCGQAYLSTNISDGQFDAPDNSGDGYEFSQTRGVLVLDTSGAEDPEQRIGYVAVAPIGMAQVSSAVMTAKVGDELAKGDEFGYFQFGGSDIIMLFEGAGSVQHYRYGQAVAYWWKNP